MSPPSISPFTVEHTEIEGLFDQERRPGMAGVSVNPLDPGAVIAWPLPVDSSDPAQISAKDASAPGLEPGGIS